MPQIVKTYTPSRNQHDEYLLDQRYSLTLGQTTSTCCVAHCETDQMSRIEPSGLLSHPPSRQQAGTGQLNCDPALHLAAVVLTSSNGGS